MKARQYTFHNQAVLQNGVAQADHRKGLRAMALIGSPLCGAADAPASSLSNAGAPVNAEGDSLTLLFYIVAHKTASVCRLRGMYSEATLDQLQRLLLAVSHRIIKITCTALITS